FLSFLKCALKDIIGVRPPNTALHPSHRFFPFQFAIIHFIPTESLYKLDLSSTSSPNLFQNAFSIFSPHAFLFLQCPFKPDPPGLSTLPPPNFPPHAPHTISLGSAN